MSVSRSRSILSPNNSGNFETSNGIANGNSAGSSVGASSGGSSRSSGYVKDRYTEELPSQQLRLLCEHLDEMQVWTQLAEVMQLRPADVKVSKLNWRQLHSLAPTLTLSSALRQMPLKSSLRSF